ncbi:MAG TPA: nitroreductase family protein [Dehalococcoidia bacterium]|nr:nitroreductase family protein [Dehalococcoidia bacterium]
MVVKQERKAMTLEEAIEGRCSVRKFSDDPVPEEDLRKMLWAAGRAPSAGNQQMWHFLIIKSKEVRERMRQAVLDKVEEMLTWEAAKGWEERITGIRGYGTFFANAPIAVAVLTKPYDNPLDSHILPAHGLSFKELYDLRGDPGRQSLGAAISNFLLMAHALGYGTCWMTGPLIAKPAMEKILDVQLPWSLAAITPLGVPAESPVTRKRRDVSEIFTVIE